MVVPSSGFGAIDAGSSNIAGGTQVLLTRHYAWNSFSCNFQLISPTVGILDGGSITSGFGRDKYRN